MERKFMDETKVKRTIFIFFVLWSTMFDQYLKWVVRNYSSKKNIRIYIDLINNKYFFTVYFKLLFVKLFNFNSILEVNPKFTVFPARFCISNKNVYFQRSRVLRTLLYASR